ncbi:helix-turn-helix domain-containing protein [Roseovarius sp. MMSF_3281]|uniref:helix-turn-helix domain-containing protein n=1 Tax=Roseovarius sp. MMSF_3281 TaxID=3046694 RepID=UPI00273F4D30|nr:helix-turn-helix transcriptional regulator [Roseovarius sp. MMSF_3281]
MPSPSLSSRPQPEQDPAKLRSMFGRNLQILSAAYPSVAGLCRELGINRTQFNRYLSGESFPRPDVLHRICRFFGVDARILLEPVEALAPSAQDLLNHPELEGFFGAEPLDIPEVNFPDGFYRFVRRSFLDHTQLVLGLVFVKRRDGYTFLRSYEPRRAMRGQGLSVAPRDREFRGLFLRQQEGVIALASHRDTLSCSFNFLSRQSSFRPNIWEGYATRSIRESVSGQRATRMVYEHLGRFSGQVMATARDAGLVSPDSVPEYHLRLLRMDQEFR